MATRVACRFDPPSPPGDSSAPPAAQPPGSIAAANGDVSPAVVGGSGTRRAGLCSMKPLIILDVAALSTAHGGMRLDQVCSSYNVEDRRPGAGTRAQQRARVDQWNREAGC